MENSTWCTWTLENTSLECRRRHSAMKLIDLHTYGQTHRQTDRLREGHQTWIYRRQEIRPTVCRVFVTKTCFTKQISVILDGCCCWSPHHGGPLVREADKSFFISSKECILAAPSREGGRTEMRVPECFAERKTSDWPGNSFFLLNCLSAPSSSWSLSAIFLRRRTNWKRRQTRGSLRVLKPLFATKKESHPFVFVSEWVRAPDTISLERASPARMWRGSVKLEWKGSQIVNEFSMGVLFRNSFLAQKLGVNQRDFDYTHITCW